MDKQGDYNHDEIRQVEALQRYGVLTSSPDQIFDCITAAAAAACGTPAALITLLHPERIMFLSHTGCEASSVSPDISFCSHAVTNSAALLVVSDAAEDSRFKHSPFFVGDSRIRFYAGKPLCTPEGCVLGTLCVVGFEPRSLSAIQRSTLCQLASLVMRLLELRASAPLTVTARNVEGKLPNGVVITDPGHADHPITFCNKGFEELTGYSLLEITGKNCRFLQGKDTDQEQVRSVRRAVDNQEPMTTVLKNYRKDGTEFWNEITLSPVRDGNGKLSHYLGFQCDVSARVIAQDMLENNHVGSLQSVGLHAEVSEALVEANAALLREIAQRKQLEMQSMKLQDELAHISRLSTMGEMATGLAHELNQPLLVISQSADTASLLAEQAGQCDPDLLECINDIQAETQRAGEIIRALRQFIVRGTTNRSEVDLNDLARQAVQLTKSASRELDVDIYLDQTEIPQPYVDRVQIAQVIVNLLRNSVDAIRSACKVEGESVRHSVCVRTVLDDDRVLVTVTDTGPGFEPEFEPFRAFVTSKEGGLGVGLSISRSIIEAHGGKLWVEKHRACGCKMLFTLPLEFSKSKVEGKL